jgi:hypothetical protein
VKTNNLKQQKYGKFQQLLMEVLGFVFFLSSLKYVLALLNVVMRNNSFYCEV